MVSSWYQWRHTDRHAHCTLPISVQIHVSVFITSQENKIQQFQPPGDHIPQASVLVFKIGFFFLPDPNTDSKPSGTQSLLLRNRCNLCFCLTDAACFRLIVFSWLHNWSTIDDFAGVSLWFARIAYKVPTELCHGILLCSPIKHWTPFLPSFLFFQFIFTP